MSLRLDLDEMDEVKLADELQRRLQSTKAGRCDYCGRAPDTTPCKFPERHTRKVGWDEIIINKKGSIFRILSESAPKEPA